MCIRDRVLVVDFGVLFDKLHRFAHRQIAGQILLRDRGLDLIDFHLILFGVLLVLRLQIFLGRGEVLLLDDLFEQMCIRDRPRSAPLSRRGKLSLWEQNPPVCTGGFFRLSGKYTLNSNIHK